MIKALFISTVFLRQQYVIVTSKSINIFNIFTKGAKYQF